MLQLLKRSGAQGVSVGGGFDHFQRTGAEMLLMVGFFGTCERQNAFHQMNIYPAPSSVQISTSLDTLVYVQMAAKQITIRY